MINIKTVLLSSILASSIFAQSVSLDEAIAIALENNKQLKVSEISLKVADTLYNQAMSAHYPTLDVSLSAMRFDEAFVFEMRGTTTIDNQQTKAMYSGLSSAAQADNGGVSNSLSTAFGMIAEMTPKQTVLPIDMQVKTIGRDTAIARADFVLPLYTGGKISAIVEQAKIGKAISAENRVRTRNQVIYDVKKYYYGAIIAKKLAKLTSDTLERMSFIRDLTSQMYEGGSMSVKKTDYLRSKMSVNMISVIYEDIKSKEQMAKAALANVMGYSWDKEIEVSEEKLPTPVMDKSMQAMVEEAHKFNPDYKTIKLALGVKDAQIDEAQSAYLPNIAFIAGAQTMYNDYEYGMVNDRNKDSWNIGVGLEWSLFNGMRTSNQVEQSKLEKLKMQEQEVLLEDGLALQIKQAYLEMGATYNKYKVLVDGVQIAEENRDLNIRAYQEDLVETKDVIEAQIFEALTQADYYRVLNDHAMAKAKADLIIGTALEDLLKN